MTSPTTSSDRSSPAQTPMTRHEQRNQRSEVLIIFCLFYLYFFWRQHSILESNNASVETPLFVYHVKASTTNKEDTVDSILGRYIVFHSVELGQGYGNIMNGLLAAHLFGIEFNRTVCLTSAMSSFLSAFESVENIALQECPSVLQKMPPQSAENSLTIITFLPPPNECVIQQKMANSTIPVIHLHANTYPGWPVVPHRFFFRFYRPRDSFVRLLPYNNTNPPETVVHLRLSDGNADRRAGLDQQTFRALGEALPKNTTYLVTNFVPWFDFFAWHYGWQHPQWKTVSHSAGLPTQDWGLRETANTQTVMNEKDEQELQVWVDWYTILRAKTVYHTHSDFSISAIHWMNIMDSKSIAGIKQVESTSQLELLNESWRRDGELKPLVQRIIKDCRIKHQ